MLYVALLNFTLMISACSNPDQQGKLKSSPTENANAQIDQSRLCIITSAKPGEAAKECKPGQKIVFAPGSWGNEQMPVGFAAFNCDLRYSVVMDVGGVTCIYNPSAYIPSTSK